MPLAATGMDLEIVVLNEVSQVEKDKCCMRSLVCGLSKSGANNLSTKWRVRDRKQALITKGKRRGRDTLGDWG